MKATTATATTLTTTPTQETSFSQKSVPCRSRCIPSSPIIVTINTNTNTTNFVNSASSQQPAPHRPRCSPPSVPLPPSTPKLNKLRPPSSQVPDTYRVAQDLAGLLNPDLEVVQRVLLAVSLQVSSDVLGVLVKVLRTAVRHAVTVTFTTVTTLYDGYTNRGEQHYRLTQVVVSGVRRNSPSSRTAARLGTLATPHQISAMISGTS